jgi:outer membrane protein
MRKSNFVTCRERLRFAAVLLLLSLPSEASGFLAPVDFAMGGGQSREGLNDPIRQTDRSQSSSDTLSLVNAVKAALSAHPAVSAAGAGLAAAKEETGEYRGALLPGLALSGSATQYQEPMVATPIHGLAPGTSPPFDQTLYQGALVMSYTLFDGGGRGARIRIGNEGVGAAEANLTQVTQGLAMSTASAYLELMGAREILAAHDRRLIALGAEGERVRQMTEVGRAAEVDLLRVEAAISGADAERVGMVGAVERAEGRLARLMGEPVERIRNARLTPVTDLQKSGDSAETLMAEAMRANPDLQRMRREAAAADAAVGVARAGRLPRVDLSALYMERGGGSVEFQGEWSLGAQISFPLFTGGAVSSRIGKAAAQTRAAQDRVLAQEIEVENALENALTSVRESESRVRSLERLVAGAEEVARIEHLRLQAGMSAEADYLGAEADLLEARANLIRARYGGVGARLQVGLVTGRLTVEWIQETLGG